MKRLFHDPAPLIRRVYSYVAYRIGDGPDAEDVTSEVFERALRYRDSYDRGRGEVVYWLIGIARRCVDEALAASSQMAGGEVPDVAGEDELATEVARRLELGAALEAIDVRSRELIALRYGADLPVREVARIVGLEVNATEVALHRARQRLRAELERDYDDVPRAPAGRVQRA